MGWHIARRNPGYSNEDYSGQEANDALLRIQGTRNLAQHFKMAMGGNPDNDNVIEVMEIACDECPVGGYEVGQHCRGCLAHRCADACKFGAITIDEHQKAHIDKSKCKECGAWCQIFSYSL